MGKGHKKEPELAALPNMSLRGFMTFLQKSRGALFSGTAAILLELLQSYEVYERRKHPTKGVKRAKLKGVE